MDEGLPFGWLVRFVLLYIGAMGLLVVYGIVSFDDALIFLLIILIIFSLGGIEPPKIWKTPQH